MIYQVLFSCLSLLLSPVESPPNQSYYTTPESMTILNEICQGSLGENIFEEGDFGSGITNVLPTDPGYAPGYIYTTNPPPDDGYYSITNDMSKWTNNFPAFIDISDNSSDPNGYMMVVNASFSPGIFYEQEITDLCENTLYEFSADIINIIKTGTAGHILPNVSFLINGIEAFSSGNIPQDETWKTYGFTFTTEPGQTTLTLTLRNNAPGGIGNDLALDNITFRACGPTASAINSNPGRICENSLYPTLFIDFEADDFPGFLQWQVSYDLGLTWLNIPGATDTTYQVDILSAGEYLFRYLFSNAQANLDNPKCRVSSDILPVIVVPLEWDIVDTICQGLTFELGDDTYDASGIYKDSLISSLGCDSIVTLYLTVMEDPDIEPVYQVTKPNCVGYDDGLIELDSLTGGYPPFLFEADDGRTFTEFENLSVSAGIYQVTVTDRFGCTDDRPVTVIDPDLFFISDLSNDSLILGHQKILEPVFNDTVASLNWEPANGLSCSSCATPIAGPVQTTTYTLEATSQHGCTAVESFEIAVIKTERVYLSNVFSPNQDGINDMWLPQVDPLNVLSIKNLQIADRWGTIIFNQNDILPGSPQSMWDGTYNGKNVPAGVYVFVIQVELADQSTMYYQGDIQLIR